MTDLVAEILALKAERRAAIVAHNYQRPEIQDVADVVADSLTMARRATEIDAPVIVICGVHFMAETAAIANRDKQVLIPDAGAGCSLAATIQAADVRAWRAQHPDGVVVAYVNTSAAVKAEVDYCCTSGNAVAVINALPRDVPVLFLPDFFLGNYLRRVTGRPLDVWMGECHVHAALTPDVLERKRREHPDAEFLVHPECGCVTSAMYYAEVDGDVAAGRTRIVSTEQMMRRARFERQGLRGGDGDGRAAPPAPREPREAVPRRGRVGGVPPHEDDHPREPPELAPRTEIRGDRAARDGGPGAARHRADARDWLTRSAWTRCAGRWRRTG